MATLPTQSFQTMVSNIVAGIQGRASKLVNFAIGSTLRAIAEGFAGVFLWFQALVLELLTATRLSTSQGVDVDTFTADFMPTIGVSNGVQSPRLGAQKSSGRVTFGRYTAAPSSCFIPVGATVRTADGTQDFVVTADPANTAYSASLSGYTLPAAVATVSIPVEAVVAGAAGNVTIGAITVMTSPVTGIDYVVNEAALTNGADQESDTSLKARFSAYILGLARGDIFGLTSSMIGAAVNIQWTLTEFYNFDGSARYGFFFVVGDDGSGNPSPDFLAAVSAAAQAVRPLGIQCAVFPPTIVAANVTMQVTTAPGYDHNTIVAQVIAKITAGIDGLGLGNPLPFSILSSWAYSVPGVIGVTGILLNGLSGDAASLVATRNTLDGYTKIADRTIKAGTILVS